LKSYLPSLKGVRRIIHFINPEPLDIKRVGLVFLALIPKPQTMTLTINLHSTPYTLHPTPYTLHPTP
jgi:hypothetical protein